jgi:hypothetical protein
MKKILLVLACLVTQAQAQTPCALPCLITGTDGPQGPVGPAGPQGPQGIQGPQGVAGPASLGALMQPTGRLSIATAVGQAASATWNTDIVGKVLSYIPVGRGNTVPAIDSSGNPAPVQFTSSMTDAVGAQLDLAGNTAWAAGSIHDVYWSYGSKLCTVAWVSGVPAISDASYAGLKVNGAAIPSCRTSATATVACPQYQCTYLGSILIDAATAGQMSCLVSFGQRRTCGVWNAYNQIEVMLSAGNTNAATNTVAPPTNGVFAPILGDPGNSLIAFTGRPTLVHVEFRQALWFQVFSGYSAQAWTSQGWNSTSVQSGSAAGGDIEGYTGTGYQAGGWPFSSSYRNNAAQGANVVYALIKTQAVNGNPVNTGTSVIYIGGSEWEMQLTAKWMG